MRKSIMIIFGIIIIVLLGWGGYSYFQKPNGSGIGVPQNSNSSSSQGAIPQSGDLCGGTGGNGQIVSIGNNTFTLKKDDNSNLVVHTTGQTTIKTSRGSISLSDLKIGNRVTLVGRMNSDGSFNANGVYACSVNSSPTQSNP